MKNVTDEPEFSVLVRWGNFRLSIVGRAAILAWLTVIASLLGFKLLL